VGLVIRLKIRRDIVVEVMFCTSTKQNSIGEEDELRGSVIKNNGTLVSKIKSPHDTEAWTIVIFVKTPECCSLPGSGAHCWSLPFSPGVCEDMTGVLSLLHKGDPLADQPTHWRPVVLLNSMNQLLSYIINERLMELVEHERILTQTQGGFHQDESTGINACKLYSLTREAQRLKEDSYE
jgi:hypothetical protein